MRRQPRRSGRSFAPDLRPTGSPAVCIKPGRQRQKVAAEVRGRVLERDGHACCRCGARDGEPREAIYIRRGQHQWERVPQEAVTLTLDHIVPVSLGGCSHAHNLRVLCRDCNQAKGSEAPASHQRRFG